jgi:hypothetical protein
MADISDKIQNVNIVGTDESMPADVVEVDGVKRLAVDILGAVTISGDESPTKYQARFFHNSTGVSVGTGADVSLLLFNGEGVLDFIGIGFNAATYEVIIKIDGVEQLRISSSQLAAIGLQNTTTSPMWIETADKNFRFNPQEGAGFSTSFEVLARSTSGTVTARTLITYREKV